MADLRDLDEFSRHERFGGHPNGDAGALGVIELVNLSHHGLMRQSAE
jgi:hypothetical protein